MALNKLDFASGLVKDDTAYTAKGGYVDGNNVRFRQGKPQTRGGWEIVATTAFNGLARGIKAWSDLTGSPQLAFGTASNLFVLTGGQIIDITPPLIETVLANPFTTVLGSSAVTVAQTEHGFAVGQPVTFGNGAPVGGLTLNGPYTVATIVSRNSYTITAGGNATSSATGGGTVDVTAPLQAGNVDGLGGLGYGTGGYGQGPYGLPSISDFLPRVWSLDNFGEVLLANPRGGALFAWQPAVTYPNVATGTWATGTGWTAGGTASAGTASNYSQNVVNALRGGYLYRVTFTAAISAGTVRFQVNAGTPSPALIDLGPASIAISRAGTYTRTFVCPANPSDIVFAKDSAFAGSITDVTLALESKAFRVLEAPTRIDGMFVDPHRSVVTAGTIGANGTYNPLLLRWSDLANFHNWTAGTGSFSGEIAIAGGGRIVGGLPSRSTNLIWTDSALSAMQFNTGGFSVNLVGTGCGLIGKFAVCEYNGVAFWLSTSGNFYKTAFDFQGAIPQVIDCRIRADVFNNIAASQGEKVFASINAQFSEVQWFVPDQRDGNECSRTAVYNFVENHWTAWTEARSSWVDAGVFPYPIACGTDGNLYYHEKGTTANGMPLPNFLETAYFDIEDGGNLMITERFVPDFQGQKGNIDVVFSGKLWPNTSEVMMRSRTSMPTTRKLDFRLKARQAKIRFSSTAAWRGGSWRIEAQKSGAQR